MNSRRQHEIVKHNKHLSYFLNRMTSLRLYITCVVRCCKQWSSRSLWGKWT